MAKKPTEAEKPPASEEGKEDAEAEEEISEEELKAQQLDHFRKAGKIHQQVVEYIKPLVKVGVKYVRNTLCNYKL